MDMMAIRRAVASNQVALISRSGNPLSFRSMPGTLPSCAVNIEPNQNLHGYGRPWIGGNGKNIIDADGFIGNTCTKNADGSYSLEFSSTSVTSRATAYCPLTVAPGDYTISATCGKLLSGNYINMRLIVDGTAQTGMRFYDGDLALVGGRTSRAITIPSYTTSMEIQLYFANASSSQSGDTLIFSDFMLESGNAVTDYEPYENICPVNGYAECNLVRTGKNMMPVRTGDPITSRGITFTFNENGSITVSGSSESTTTASYAEVIRGKILKPGVYKKTPDQSGICLFIQYIASASEWKTVPGGGPGYDTFEITQDIYDNYDQIIRIRVHQGTSFSTPVTFEPYIYHSTETSLAWEEPEWTNIKMSWGTPIASSAITRGYYSTSKSWNANNNYITYTVDLSAGEYVFKSDLETCYILRYFIDDAYTNVQATTSETAFTMPTAGTFTICIRKNPSANISAITPESTIGSFVYGGTLNPLTGTLIVNRAFKMLTGTETFNLATATRRFTINTSSWDTYSFSSASQNTAEFICSHEVYRTDATGTSRSLQFRATSASALAFYDPGERFADVTAFKAYLADQYQNGTPVSLSYKLATPVTYQLTPQQVTALQGQNNLWTDTKGNIDIQYWGN